MKFFILSLILLSGSAFAKVKGHIDSVVYKTNGKKNSDFTNLIPKTTWFKNIANPRPIGTASMKNTSHLRLFQSEI